MTETKETYDYGQVTTWSLRAMPWETFDAAELAELIRDDLRAARNDVYAAGDKLMFALHRQDWRALGYKSADDYLESFGIAPSWGYRQVRVAELKAQFPELAERLAALDVSKAIAVASYFEQDRKDRIFDADRASVERLLDVAEANTVRGLAAALEDARGPQAPGGSPFLLGCPNCGRQIAVSRAVTLVE